LQIIDCIGFFLFIFPPRADIFPPKSDRTFRRELNPPPIKPFGGRKMLERPDLSALLKELPPFVARTFPRFKELTGYSSRTVANLDCLGQGPKKRILLGNTVAYERESLIEWLEARSRTLS